LINNPRMKTSDDILNARQVSKELGLSYEQARAMFRLGQIGTIMVGKKKVTTRRLLDQWKAGEGPRQRRWWHWQWWK
jgi:hypothetical protein